MALLNDQVDGIREEEITPLPRYQETPTGGGGLGVAGVVVPEAGQAYELEIDVFCTSQTTASTARTFLGTLLDGTTFTYTAKDPTDAGTYTCRVLRDNPVPRRYSVPGYWEWRIRARGTRA